MTTSEDQPTTGTKDQWTPPPKSGGIRVQRGITTGAATITIDPVDMTKAVVLSNSKGSAGSVPVSGYINTSGSITVGGYRAGVDSEGYDSGIHPKVRNYAPSGEASYPATVTQSGNITPSGTTNLTTKQFSARLTSETTLQCDGAVEWQVVEYL